MHLRYHFAIADGTAHSFDKRLRTIKVEGAGLNAIANLDVFTTFTTMTLESDHLAGVEDRSPFTFCRRRRNFSK